MISVLLNDEVKVKLYGRPPEVDGVDDVLDASLDVCFKLWAVRWHVLMLKRWHLAQLQARLCYGLDHFEVLGPDVAGLDMTKNARLWRPLHQFLNILHALHHFLDVLDQEILVDGADW